MTKTRCITKYIGSPLNNVPQQQKFVNHVSLFGGWFLFFSQLSFHKINSHKTLYITATEKNIDNKTNKVVYSMDDDTIFGKHIYPPISIKWAIDNNKITDYKVALLKNTEEQVDNIIKNIGVPISNKELFISAYLSLKSIQKYSDLTHLLIYCNKTDNATLIIKYIDLIIENRLIVFERDTLYYKDYHFSKA